MNMRPKASTPTLLGAILFNFALICPIILINSEETNEVSKVFVDLDALPEPFSNDHLPNSNQKTNKCYEFLGCIERLPKLQNPQEPSKMKAEFKLITSYTEQYIPYGPIINCLSGSNECATYPYNLSALVNSSFNPNLRTIILIGGYMSGVFEGWQMEVNNIWSKLESVNVLLVSWSGGNRGLYQFAAANTRIVSRQITVLLYYLAKVNNLDLNDESISDRIHLIGHSLGAHMAGFVGQDFGGKIGRITGLDTAGPNFSGFNESYRLDRSDAQFVDSLHTNGGNLSLGQAYFGIEMPVGHLDYYANDGKHQPNCKFNSFGCSHKVASDLFISFLRHEQYMREHFQSLKHEYHDYHRIFAYRSDDYESFNNGSSLAQLCPITTLGDNDLQSEDINQCVVPIDFITRFHQLKTELAQKYQIDFDANSRKGNKFFFYTSADAPYLNHHNLIRMRVTKSDNLQKNPDAYKACDIVFDINMANGMGSDHEITRYNLIDEGDHYEIIVPYLSPNTASKYALATIDANDFFSEELDKLQTNIAKVFPSSIKIKGMIVGQAKQRPRGNGLLDVLQSLFGMAKSRKNEEVGIHECSLNIESVSVQPMKKLHRHFVALYSTDASDKASPDVMFLFKEDSLLPKIQVLPESKDTQMFDKNRVVSEIFIDSVVIGPLTQTPKVETESSDVEVIYESNEQASYGHNTETSSISASSWLKLTILVVLLTLLIISIVMYKFLMTREIAEDKSTLITA